MNTFTASLLASIVLTVLLNLGLRALTRNAHRNNRRVDRWAQAQQLSLHQNQPRQTRPTAQWKSWLMISIMLTVLVNLVLWVL